MALVTLLIKVAAQGSLVAPLLPRHRRGHRSVGAARQIAHPPIARRNELLAMTG
ncbi:MAG: hypothetical protein ACRDRH_20490 [Pseudonocardia sp.]